MVTDSTKHITLERRMTHRYSGIAPSAIALSVVGGASLLIVFLFDPATYGFYPVCFFHLLTGLYCPGCGGLRATHELLHGHVAAAARLNLLVVLALPAAAFWKVRRIRRIWAWMLLVVSALFTIARNVPGGEWLSP